MWAYVACTFDSPTLSIQASKLGMLSDQVKEESISIRIVKVKNRFEEELEKEAVYRLSSRFLPSFPPNSP
jgi:hypothetical protein